MDNDTFRTLSEKATVVLEFVDLDQYYGGRTAVDEAIGVLGRAWREASAEQRAWFTASLSTHARRVLGRFCLRAPMLALRGEDGAILGDGLGIHALLEQQMRDPRDDMIGFALYHFVAGKLGLDPVKLFDDAAVHAVPELADVMKTFGRRKGVTLGAFGWRRVETAEGPSFEMLGWRQEPLGAVVGEPSWDTVNSALARELLEWARSQSVQERPN